MAPDRADIGDGKVAMKKYELLRANALGHTSRASGFTLFLRYGMSAWLRTLSDQGCVRRKMCQDTSFVFAGAHVDMSGADLASIITDAILSAAPMAIYTKGDV
jgi:hypothetical protein